MKRPTTKMTEKEKAEHIKRLAAEIDRKLQFVRIIQVKP